MTGRTDMRNLNALDAPLKLTTDDEVLDRQCPSCGADVQVTIPAGTPTTTARFMRRLKPECDPCAERREAEDVVAERKRLRAARAESSNLPRPLRGLTWESYTTDDQRWPNAAKAAAAARAWAAQRDGHKGLWVHGPVGVGKTRLAATAAWELLGARHVRYVSVPDLIITLSAAFADKDRAMALKVLTGKGALVLDDLDKIPPSATVLAHIYTAVNSRYEARAPLFVTTNLKPSELVDYLSGGTAQVADPQKRMTAEAIVSRLMEHCSVGAITGPDRRRV